MDKEVMLLDYKDISHIFTIKNFEKVKSCFINILNGDWVLYVIYDNNEYEVFEANEEIGGRQVDFYDGTYIINPERIDELWNSNIKHSYELEDLL